MARSSALDSALCIFFADFAQISDLWFRSQKDRSFVKLHTYVTDLVRHGGYDEAVELQSDVISDKDASFDQLLLVRIVSEAPRRGLHRRTRYAQRKKSKKASRRSMAMNSDTRRRSDEPERKRFGSLKCRLDRRRSPETKKTKQSEFNLEER